MSRIIFLSNSKVNGYVCSGKHNCGMVNMPYFKDCDTGRCFCSRQCLEEYLKIEYGECWVNICGYYFVKAIGSNDKSYRLLNIHQVK